MENFITGTSSIESDPSKLTSCFFFLDTGFPGCEFQIRTALADVLGERKAEYFFDKV